MSELQRIVRMSNNHYHFAVVGELGAIHFHFQVGEQFLNSPFCENSIYCSLGLETHYANCPEWRDPENPLFEDCWLTHKKCWSDGTSLWASEYWMPRFIANGTDWLWPRLEQQYRETFESVKGQ